MTPNKRKTVNGKLVEEYYWSRQLVVYIDHYPTEESYDEAISRLSKEQSDADSLEIQSDK